MNDKINISKGDIPETDAEVEKILAKKPTTKRKLALVQTPEQTQEKEAEKETPVQTPAQAIVPHSELVWHGSISGLDVYGFSSQEILDACDRCYAFYKTTPTVFLWGEVVCNDKIIRIKQETAEYVNVTDNHWHLTYSHLDVEPINGVFPKARIGVTRADAFERFEETPERKTYRAKLLDAIKQH